MLVGDDGDDDGDDGGEDDGDDSDWDDGGKRRGRWDICFGRGIGVLRRRTLWLFVLGGRPLQMGSRSRREGTDRQM